MIYGDLLTIEEWESMVRCGAFIDYDGYGRFCDSTGTREDKDDLYPSEYGSPDYLDRKAHWTHVMWYNR